MFRVSENRLNLLLRGRATHASVLRRLLSTRIKEEKTTLEDAGIISNRTIHEKQNHHIEGITKDNDLELLEKGIRKSDEMTSNFTNYMYRFHRLPPNYGSNQLITIDKELQRELHGVMASFKAPCRFAFGYGSGVFEQAGYSKTDSKPQIDIILGVTHPSHFHSINMRQNPHHYSSLKYFGSEFVSKFQEIGAGVYFNPFANINGHDVKYGVVSMETLLKDVATWNTFYIAGRLQKPVKILKNDLRVQYWNQLNLKAAATLAKHYTLEKNNNKFDEFQFYKEITALSYAGDIRYKLGGENPDKVNNIVTKNFERFQIYYKPIYKEVVLNDSFYLPKGFTLKNTQRLLLSRISKSSALQTIKGVFTAGVTKSIKYAWAKKMKSMKRS
ncbi:Mitochondrial translocator assembly and maintenance protein 41 [Saccharomyces pastorianus]|uniref:Phosphatidate cytidylyltransferase, mitochondrial n=1 Tax=Saccharomyces pastorianus TaxID=27292 RepID=A0A6C1E6Y8_SACPS|nr:Mitochondrial translocator assembly and maintenance protein 41 [Saccharomyces pastorianus]